MNFIARLACLVLFCPSLASALSLGALHCESPINAPLKASISVTLAPDEQISQFSIDHTSPKDYGAAGFSPNRYSRHLQIQWVTDTITGQPYLAVSTRSKFTSPRLDVVIALKKDDGSRFTQGLQANLDLAHASAALFDGFRYGPIRHNDTLWSIALLMGRNHDVSQEAMVLALAYANQGSIRQPGNQLIMGQFLHMPPDTLLHSLTSEQAKKAYAIEKPLILSGHSDKSEQQAPTMQETAIRDLELPIVKISDPAEAPSPTNEASTTPPIVPSTDKQRVEPQAVPNLLPAEASQTILKAPPQPGLYLLMLGLGIALGASLTVLAFRYRTTSNNARANTEPGVKFDASIDASDMQAGEFAAPQPSLSTAIESSRQSTEWVGNGGNGDNGDIERILTKISDLRSKDQLILKPDGQSQTTGNKNRSRQPQADTYQDITDNDPLETRLDLAKSYWGMGEVRQAKKILKDVLNKGNEPQIREAIRLMNLMDA